MEQAISDFLLERKNDWLKKRMKGNLTDDQKAIFQDEADTKFSKEVWLPDAAKRASQLTMSSHPSKFSHTASKTSTVIASCASINDGYLRSGNCEVELDVFGNAAAMDVYKFLQVKLSDKNTLLHHIENETAIARKELETSLNTFEELREGFLQVKESGSNTFTSDLVKQVYFPIEKNKYHLLSVLTPSPIMYKLAAKITEMKFSDETKIAREMHKSVRESETGYDEIFGLAMIGFGGTKPQNVSVFNNTYGGKSYLLPSMPPMITEREYKLPRSNFFKNSLNPYRYKEEFYQLQRIITQDENNLGVRNAREEIIQAVIDKVIDLVWTIRKHDEGWSNTDYYSGLPKHHKIFLDEFYVRERENEELWVDKVARDFALWIRHAYEKVIGKKAQHLYDNELIYFKALVENSESILKENKENFR